MSNRKYSEILLTDEAMPFFNRLESFAKNNGVNSNAMSSHWRHFSSNSICFADGNTIKFKTVGLDDYINNDIINRVRNIPSTIYLNKLCKKLPNNIHKAMLKVCEGHNRAVSFNCVKQALSLNQILESNIDLEDEVVGVIGDGHGFMGCLIKQLFPSARIIQINLAKNLLLDYVLSSTFGREYSFNIVLNDDEFVEDFDFNFIPAELIFEIYPKNIGFFINIASMGEMDQEIISKYFELMRSQNTKSTFFYCCNRKEKDLPDGSKTFFSNYGWSDKDTVIFEEYCAWYAKYPMNRPPFMRAFDGVFLHKLLEISR